MSKPRIIDTDDDHRIEVVSNGGIGEQEILTVLVYQRLEHGEYELVSAFEIDPDDLRYLLTGKG